MLCKLNVTVLSSAVIAAWELCVLRKVPSLSFLSIFIFIFRSYSHLFCLLIVGVEGCIFAWSQWHTHTHTHTHTFHSSRRGIAQSQRPLPDNIQYSQETDIPALGGIGTPIPASERPQSHTRRRGHWNRQSAIYLCTFCSLWRVVRRNGRSWSRGSQAPFVITRPLGSLRQKSMVFFIPWCFCW